MPPRNDQAPANQAPEREPLPLPETQPLNPQAEAAETLPAAGATGEEIEVETTGDFMLQDPYSGKTIEATGSTKVPVTAFITDRLAGGQLKKAGRKSKAQDDE